MKPNVVKIIFTDTTVAPFKNAEMWMQTDAKVPDEKTPMLVHTIGGQGEHMLPAEAARRLSEYVAKL